MLKIGDKVRIKNTNDIYTIDFVFEGKVFLKEFKYSCLKCELELINQ